MLNPRVSVPLFATTFAFAAASAQDSATSAGMATDSQILAQTSDGSGQQPARPGSAVTAKAGAPGADTGNQVLDEVVVRAVSFKYEEAQSATKMPLSVKDTPQAVKVVTQDLIEFSGIRKFEDIYKIDASGGSSHAGDQLPRNYFRGFATQGINAIKVDGFRMPADVQLDLAPFERFEVVKGATSTLYGQNSIAGTLNAVSKQPQDVFGGDVSLEIGSYAHYRGDLDVYGPLDADGKLTYRFVGAYLDEESFVDFVYDKRTVLAPTLRYQFDDNTSITGRVIYQKSDFTPYYGYGAQFLGDDITDPAQLTAENFRLPQVPRNRTGNTPFNHADKDALLALATLEHVFDDSSWKLRANVQYSHIDASLAGDLMLGTDRDGLTDNSLYMSDTDDMMYSGEVNLFGDVELFGRQHTLFVGLDYARMRETLDYFFTDLYGVDNGFSILHPDYSLLTFPRRGVDYEGLSADRTEREMYGLTLQALLRPADGLTISLGARYSNDVTDAWSACCDDMNARPEDVPRERQKEDAVTFQGGVTYAINPSLNAYLSYGETFEPQPDRTVGGDFVDPLEGRSYEVGVKGDALQRRISYSLALFDMQLSNIAQPVPGTPWVIPAGTQRSRGVELDFQGEVVPGWSVYTSVAWMKSEFTEGELKGIKTVNAPRFGLSLFTSYEIQDGPLQGLGVGGGVVHKHDLTTSDIFSYGARTPISLLPDFTEVDLRVFYTHQNWQYEVAVSNLFNEEYASAAFSQLLLGFQENPPRQVLGSVRYRF